MIKNNRIVKISLYEAVIILTKSYLICPNFSHVQQLHFMYKSKHNTRNFPDIFFVFSVKSLFFFIYESNKKIKSDIKTHPSILLNHSSLSITELHLKDNIIRYVKNFFLLFCWIDGSVFIKYISHRRRYQ